MNQIYSCNKNKFFYEIIMVLNFVNEHFLLRVRGSGGRKLGRVLARRLNFQIKKTYFRGGPRK